MTKQVRVALLMAASLFMDILDGTIVTTALPKMAAYFKAGSGTVSLLVSVYLITVAIFIPLSGWLANRFGKKNIWLLAVFLFTISSLGNALATSFSFLLIMRVVQGIAGAMMTPTARLIVLEKTKPNQLLRMMSYLVWPALIAPAIAPLIGGFIVTYWNWRWIFLINLPIGAIILIIGIFMLDKDRATSTQSFDSLGFFEIAVASGLLLTGAELLTRGTNLWAMAGVLIVLSIFSFVVAVQHLRKARTPLFSLEALKVASFKVCQTSGSILWLSVGAMPYMMTIYLQTIFNWSAVKAGSYVLFIFLGNIGIKPFTTRIITGLRYRWSLILSFVMVFVSAVLLSLINTATSGIIIAVLAFISGAGRSLALTAYSALTFADVPAEERNSANTLNAIIQTMAQGLGVSIVTVVVHMAANFVTLHTAYQWGFVFLGILMIYPIIETLKLNTSLGENTLK